jgi:DNA-binding response OmpR family regulator
MHAGALPSFARWAISVRWTMGDGKRILVVEDYEPMAGAIESMLTMRGYRVLRAANGIEALQAMGEIVPDLIIADILMPEMDGYAFYQEVQKRSEWRHIPFIFLTSMAEREDIQKGLELGVDTYITKPFDPEDLLAATRAELKGQEGRGGGSTRR